jgi:hypothetical protein
MRNTLFKVRPGTRRALVGPLLACALLAPLAACSQDQGAPFGPPAPAPDGAVRGHLLFVGGPAPGRPHGIAGTLTLTQRITQTDLITRHITVDQSGSYSASIPPGRWWVQGRSPAFGSGKYPCRANSVVVVAPDLTTKVNVYCQAA